MAGNTTIRVTPTELRTVATKIRAQADDYLKQYTQLFSNVEGMSNAWKGKDNLAFTDRINSFKGDFQQMKSLLDEYAQFLDKAAQAYQDTQDKITSAAQKL